MRRPVWLAAFILLAALPMPSMAVDLAAHRAVYKLTLASSRGAVSDAGGTMAFELVDACEGWATRQRLRINTTTDAGQNIEIGSDYATLEAKDGLSLRFNMRQTTEQAVSSETEGQASVPAPGAAAGAAGEVRYTSPQAKTLALPPGTIMPNTHTIAAIDAARDGKKFIAIPLFDGTSADGAQDTSVAIFSWDKPAPHKFKVLSTLPSSRMRIAFFDRNKGATTPDYELGIRYWENGIADEISMDFGDFVMRAVLQQLTVLPKAC
ncbi:MAG: DUF1849 family protein [Acetobacteraceae bacterium]|nr:DUF1849 family protein [Acetobacteraceae bacterium]MSP29659.1 DUF1849 family protein [Acetobacteraceae bacterium]